MKTVSWKEVAEGVGVLSIVAGLALVAGSGTAVEAGLLVELVRTRGFVQVMQEVRELMLDSASSR